MKNPRFGSGDAAGQGVVRALRWIAGLLVIVWGCGCGLAKPPEFKWECASTTVTSLQCQIDLSGGDGSLCFEVVAVCSDGRHKERVCSGPMRAGETKQKVVSNLQPPLDLNVPCQGIEYENQVIE